MSVTTPGDIVRLALKDSGVLGVGQTALAEDTNDAFDTMNMILTQWQRKRWLVYHLVDHSIVSTGATSYTIGPGGDIDTYRPSTIEAAFFRQILNPQPNQVDYPLSLLLSYEDYSRITLKQLVTLPQWLFYDSSYPLGTLYPWPVIQSAIYELHVITRQELTEFTSLSQDIDLPPEYVAALRYNLAARLRPMYQLPPDPSLTALAEDSLNTLRQANVQIPRLRMPLAVQTPGLPYNIYSDSWG